MEFTKANFEQLLSDFERITPGAGQIHDYRENMHLLNIHISRWEQFEELDRLGDKPPFSANWLIVRENVYRKAQAWIHKWRETQIKKISKEIWNR